MLVPNFHSLGPAEEKNGNKRNILKILTSFYKREDGKDQITGDLSFEREEAEASVWVKVAVNFRHSAPIRLGSAVLPRDHMVADGVVHYFLQDSGHKNGRGGRGGGVRAVGPPRNCPKIALDIGVPFVFSRIIS